MLSQSRAPGPIAMFASASRRQLQAIVLGAHLTDSNALTPCQYLLELDARRKSLRSSLSESSPASYKKFPCGRQIALNLIARSAVLFFDELHIDLREARPVCRTCHA